MGPMDQLMSYLGYDVAMEADDITKEAESEAGNVVGNDGEGENNNGEIDLNTDDILGTANTDDDPTNDTDSSENTDNNDEDSENNSENENDENALNDDNSDVDGDNEMPEQPEPENSFANDRKIKLRKQFLHFYDLLSDSCKLISEFMPNVTEENTIQTLSSINKNMLQCKEEIYTIMTDEFVDTEYQDLLKKYVSLNHIYDLCITTLDKYFESANKDKDKNSKR